MAINTSELTVTNNTSKNRFEIQIEDQFAVAEYRLMNDTHIAFTHTEVPTSLEGNGIGSKLARFGLDYARKHHLKVLPYCPYIAAWIERHPDYQDLVDHNRMK